MIVGCLSYGTLKGCFYQGSPDSVKRKLAAKLHIFNPNTNPAVHGDIKILSNWLETIRQVRNMVAHHDRFWNETSTRIVPKLPKHRTPMNGGATIGTLSERTLPAPPLSSPWKTTCCNKSMAPHGRTNSSASWTAIRKFLQRKWDSPRIGDHSHCGHDDRRAP